MKRLRLFAVMLLLLPAVSLMGAETFESQIGNVKIGDVSDSGTLQVPYITWGGDVATFVANGGLTTTNNSIFGKSGLKLKLVAGDDFQSQVKDYLTGKSPYLRCETGMAALASDVVNKDPRTKPVMILQMTWSVGDHIVGREQIKSLNVLKGKKICLQKNGPHLTLLNDSLVAAGITWNDITVVWAKNLTGPDSPSEMYRKDKTIDACCVISPDMIGLCSGIDQVGSGAEGTDKGAHVVNSTASMSHSIGDVYMVRKDYYEKHHDQIELFVVGYLKATEQLLEWKKLYDDGKGKSPEYVTALTLAQSIYGKSVLPTIENDAHGLVSDANFVRIPGNEAFFNDPQNLTGFKTKTASSLEMAAGLGLITNKFGFEKADWDYNKISEKVGVKYVAPVFSTGRIKGEVTDFTKDLDSNTILSFEIKFKPEQKEFDVDSYAADFQRVVKSQASFGNAVILIRGHSDPTLALQNFYWAARANGLITGEAGNLKFGGKPISLSDTQYIVNLIQSENFAGQFRVNKEGVKVAIDDPKNTVAAALQLSQARAEIVRDTLQAYAKSKNLMVDFSQIRPQGVGIAEPIVARPKDMVEATKNMRVEFRVIRVSAENIKEGDFDFDK